MLGRHLISGSGAIRSGQHGRDRGQPGAMNGSFCPLCLESCHSAFGQLRTLADPAQSPSWVRSRRPAPGAFGPLWPDQRSRSSGVAGLGLGSTVGRSAPHRAERRPTFGPMNGSRCPVAGPSPWLAPLEGGDEAGSAVMGRVAAGAAVRMKPGRDEAGRNARIQFWEQKGPVGGGGPKNRWCVRPVGCSAGAGPDEAHPLDRSERSSEARETEQLPWNSTERWTSTVFKGRHTMTCQVERDGVVIARGIHFVRVAEPAPLRVTDSTARSRSAERKAMLRFRRARADGGRSGQASPLLVYTSSSRSRRPSSGPALVGGFRPRVGASGRPHP